MAHLIIYDDTPRFSRPDEGEIFLERAHTDVVMKNLLELYN